jgi:septal ring factor EnvC (AmiA/AmiB activator)
MNLLFASDEAAGMDLLHASDEDEQEMQLMREEELQNAVDGLGTWQTQRTAEIEKQLGELAERHVSAIAQLRRALAVDLAKATAETERRLGELKRSHSTQPMPTEDWLRGTILARQADEVTSIVGERAPVLRALQQGYERRLVVLDKAKASEDRSLHRRKQAIDGVTGQLQAMQSQLLAALARSADAERKAAGWHAESERQSHLLHEAMLRQRQHEEDDRVERASRERYNMERVQAVEIATKAAAAAKALAAEERAAREKLEDELRAKQPRRFLTVRATLRLRSAAPVVCARSRVCSPCLSRPRLPTPTPTPSRAQPCSSRTATSSPAAKQSPQTPSSSDKATAFAHKTLFDGIPSSASLVSLTLGGGSSQPLQENNATSFRLTLRKQAM